VLGFIRFPGTTLTCRSPSSRTPHAIADTPEMASNRHIGNFLKVDSAYRKGVTDAIGIPLEKVPK
jgi:hypothetical protein